MPMTPNDVYLDTPVSFGMSRIIVLGEYRTGMA
jgi:hypothetical protein